MFLLLDAKTILNFHYFFHIIFQLSDDINLLVFLESICCGFGAFSLVFFANEVGQRFSNEFDAGDFGFGQLKWYRFPKELQRILPIIISTVQHPSAVKFFGSAACSREQFKKVRILRRTFESNLSSQYCYFDNVKNDAVTCAVLVPTLVVFIHDYSSKRF